METPNLRWFDQIPKCWRCGKDAHGRLMGSMNDSYGWHCRRCAGKRLKDSERERERNRKDPTP